jgi:hypothetical protein
MRGGECSSCSAVPVPVPVPVPLQQGGKRHSKHRHNKHRHSKCRHSKHRHSKVKGGCGCGNSVQEQRGGRKKSRKVRFQRSKV